jgi:sterol desaturase/sphingolipid hydroxylase (fatty acid hydroxylase superfamily)
MPAIIYWSIPVFLLFLAWELAVTRWRDPDHERWLGYQNSDSWASLAMGVGNLVVAAVWKTVAVGALFFVYQFHLFDIDMQAWWAWALVIVGDDFCYYWFHRFGHRVRIGWAGHVNHHSSTFYNYTTALRQSWTSPFFKVWFYLPLVLVGFHPLMVITSQAISLLYQFWIHTEVIKKLPAPFEWLFNTPSHHRVHHGANDEYVDRNYGGILIIWDRLFGTFQPEGEIPHYGLRKEFHSRNPFWIAFHEWVSLWRDIRRARGWRVRFQLMFRPPGWSPTAAADGAAEQDSARAA